MWRGRRGPTFFPSSQEQRPPARTLSLLPMSLKSDLVFDGATVFHPALRGGVHSGATACGGWPRASAGDARGPLGGRGGAHRQGAGLRRRRTAGSTAWPSARRWRRRRGAWPSIWGAREPAPRDPARPRPRPRGAPCGRPGGRGVAPPSRRTRAAAPTTCCSRRRVSRLGRLRSSFPSPPPRPSPPRPDPGPAPTFFGGAMSQPTRRLVRLDPTPVRRVSLSPTRPSSLPLTSPDAMIVVRGSSKIDLVYAGRRHARPVRGPARADNRVVNRRSTRRPIARRWSARWTPSAARCTPTRAKTRAC